jgi:DNA polymerase iota
VTDIIDYNLGLLNKNSLDKTFFQLSGKDPERGFVCDVSMIPGCVEGASPTAEDVQTAEYLRLSLGSHLASYLRGKLEEDFGYTSTCGIATNKTLSKLVGARNKPRNQTTLLALTDEHVETFMDSHKLRRVPGIGTKIASILEASITGDEQGTDSDEHDTKTTVGQVRLHPATSPGSLQRLLAGPGAEKGVGARIWALLHGVDPLEVKEASEIPSQISIEDTFKGLETMPQITEELFKLSCSLIRRIRVDLLLTDDHGNADELATSRWLARPKTLRLSVRSWPLSGSLYSQNFSRTSRSVALPGFVFDFKADIESLAERLVSEALLPLLRRLKDDSGEQRWNLQLINICVANMMPTAADGKAGVGRDIGNMFRNQDEALAPWRIVPDESEAVKEDGALDDFGFDDEDAAEGWESADHTVCPHCGHLTPHFALAAHLRYHEMED